MTPAGRHVEALDVVGRDLEQPLGPQLPHALGEVVHERARDHRHRGVLVAWTSPARSHFFVSRRLAAPRSRASGVAPSPRPRVTVRAGLSRPKGFRSFASSSPRPTPCAGPRGVPSRPSTDQRPARVASGFVNAHSPLSVARQRVAALGARDLERSCTASRLTCSRSRSRRSKGFLSKRALDAGGDGEDPRLAPAASRRPRCRPGASSPRTTASGSLAPPSTSPDRRSAARRGRSRRGLAGVSATTSSGLEASRGS